MVFKKKDLRYNLSKSEKDKLKEVKIYKKRKRLQGDVRRLNLSRSKIARGIGYVNQFSSYNRQAGASPISFGLATSALGVAAPSRGVSSGRGRPAGSYDPRYAKYGGVYGYRKFLAQQIRERRMQLERQNTLSPRQQIALQRIQQQEYQAQENPENKTIPDTTGRVPLRSLHQEADDYANIFP